jgi:hypothetical protein
MPSYRPPGLRLFARDDEVCVLCAVPGFNESIVFIKLRRRNHRIVRLRCACYALAKISVFDSCQIELQFYNDQQNSPCDVAATLIGSCGQNLSDLLNGAGGGMFPRIVVYSTRLTPTSFQSEEPVFLVSVSLTIHFPCISCGSARYEP